MSDVILTCASIVLPDVLSALAVPSDAIMFLERVPSRRLNGDEIADGIRLTVFDARTDWLQWGRGRIFCQEWELRWEGQRTVYIGAAMTMPNFTPGPDLSHCTRREMSYYLWGQRDGDRFIELQVARVLTYPVAEGARVKLRVVEWFDAAGELVASRGIGLEGEK